MTDTINQHERPNRSAALWGHIRTLRIGDGLIPLILIIIISLAWWVRINALVKLEVITDNVILDLSQTWDMKLTIPLRLQSLYVDHVDIKATQNANILPIEIDTQIEKKNVYLEALKIINRRQAAKVELSANAHSLNIYTTEAHITGKFNVQGVEEKNEHAVNNENRPPEEVIHFITKPSSSGENRIELCTQGPWLLCKLQIKKMLVAKQDPKQPGKFEPSVQSGQVQILNSGKTLQLGWGDVLSLEDIVEIRRITISKKPGGFKISFLGKTASIKAGPQGYETDLRPRCLEFIYNNKPFALFLFAIGIMWKGYFYIKTSIKNHFSPLRQKE